MKTKAKAKKKNKMFIVFILIIIIIAVVIFLNKNNKDERPSIQEAVKNETQMTQGDIQLIKSEIINKGSNIVVEGVLKASRNIESVDVKLLLYNEKDQLRGESMITLEKISAGIETVFSIDIMGSYEGISNYKIEFANVK